MLVVGWDTKRYEVVLTRSTYVLVILKGGGGEGGHLQPLKWVGGASKKALPCLEGRAKSFGPATFPFCNLPLPIINTESLNQKEIYIY